MSGVVTLPPGRVSVTGMPFFSSEAKSALTVAVGEACRRIAKAPVTCGAAMEVPVAAAYRPPGYDDRIAVPGARSERNRFTFEYGARTSALLVAPTLTALEMHAGALMRLVEPSLPEAITVAMPTDRRLSIMGLWGSSSQGLRSSRLPRLRLTAAMVCWACSEYTSSSPAMTSESQASTHGVGRPWHWLASSMRENTWTAMIRAPLATPENACPAGGPFPAAMPATWVPCQQPSSIKGHGAAEPVPCACSCPFGQTVLLPKNAYEVEKHASATTLLARKGCVLSTPVSRMATAVPLPS